MSQKQILREKLMALRKGMSVSDVEFGSEAVCRLIKSLPAWAEASQVLAYWPLGNEVDVRPLIRELWERGARVFLPRCREGEPGIMDLACVAGKGDLALGLHGIMEPDKCRCPVVEDAAPDLILVPGVGFDSRGYRLGFGGGYYDRLLEGQGMSGAMKIGPCYDFQYVDRLPVDPWDKPVDAVCTEKEFKWFR